MHQKCKNTIAKFQKITLSSLSLRRATAREHNKNYNTGAQLHSLPYAKDIKTLPEIICYILVFGVHKLTNFNSFLRAPKILYSCTSTIQ